MSILDLVPFDTSSRGWLEIAKILAEERIKRHLKLDAAHREDLQRRIENGKPRLTHLERRIFRTQLCHEHKLFPGFPGSESKWQRQRQDCDVCVIEPEDLTILANHYVDVEHERKQEAEKREAERRVKAREERNRAKMEKSEKKQAGRQEKMTNTSALIDSWLQNTT